MDDKNIKQTRKLPPLDTFESIKEAGKNVLDPFKRQLEPFPENFASQLFNRFPRSISGEINPGEELQIRDVYSGRRADEEKLRKQLALERRIRQEEQSLVERKSNELRIKLHAIMEEIRLIAQVTPELTQEVQIASMQAPIEPGIYHLHFFERILEFIKSFRKKIEDASVWLNSLNKRVQKKNYWALYKKHGGKFLLSADHYLTRSAG